MQKNKFKIWVLKTTNLDTQESLFLVFEEKPPNKFWLWFSFRNNRRTNVLLIIFFENAQKSCIPSKTLFWPFLAVYNFFCVFSKILTKITFVCLLFLKLNEKKMKKKKIGWPPKSAFSSFEIKTFKQIFFIFFFCFSLKNSRRTNVI